MSVPLAQCKFSWEDVHPGTMWIHMDVVGESKDLLKDVDLKTCWMMGQCLIKHLAPRLDKVLVDLEAQKDPAVNILQPFGKPIVSAKQDTNDYDNTAKDLDNGLPNLDLASATAVYGAASLPKCPLETELEDAAGKEKPSTKHNPCFQHEGKVVFEAQYLKELFKSLKDPGSRDWLKHYADISQYTVKNVRLDHVIESDTDHQVNVPSVKMNYPIATLLKCNGKLFVCVGEVIEIVCKLKACDILSIDCLSDPTTFLQFQLLYLVPATVKDHLQLKIIGGGLTSKDQVIAFLADLSNL